PPSIDFADFAIGESLIRGGGGVNAGVPAGPQVGAGTPPRGRGTAHFARGAAGERAVPGAAGGGVAESSFDVMGPVSVQDGSTPLEVRGDKRRQPVAALL